MFFPSHNKQITHVMFSVLVRRVTVLPWLQVRDGTAVSMRVCGRPVERHLREDEFQQSNKQDEVQKSITNIS